MIMRIHVNIWACLSLYDGYSLRQLLTHHEFWYTLLLSITPILYLKLLKSTLQLLKHSKCNVDMYHVC